MSTALATIETITAVEFFKPGASKSIIDTLKTEALETAKQFDVSTPAGQNGLRSLAASIAKAKNRIDNAGKELVSGEKARLKIIDTERGTVWDELEALQKEVRQPLTDFENAEKSRVAAHEAELQELIQAGIWSQQNWQSLSVEAMRDRLKEITDSKYDWQEFLGRAKDAVIVTVSQLKDAIARRETMEKEREELERLRAEQAKRDQQDREDRIAREAKEAAEAAAKRREEESAKAAEDERKRIEAQAFEAEARAKAAEDRERLAAEKAEKDRVLAVEAEQRRIAAVAAQEKADAEKRENNKRHAAKINREVRDALITHAELEGAHARLSPAQAEYVVKMIAKGLVPHVKINY